ncbi:MAG TPA: hypothetical protein VF698_11920, partial [Thermoanaerobaculia bacterium]
MGYPDSNAEVRIDEKAAQPAAFLLFISIPFVHRPFSIPKIPRTSCWPTVRTAWFVALLMMRSVEVWRVLALRLVVLP